MSASQTAMGRWFAATRDQVRQVDRLAIERCGLPGIVLMENAGRWCALVAARMLGAPDAPLAAGLEGKDVLILCGRGNNGGDGFVVARHLSNWGASASVVLLAPAEEVLQEGNEASVNLRVLLNCGFPVREALTPQDVAATIVRTPAPHLIVDAMLGTGTRGAVREPYLSAIRAVNQSGVPVLAVDVPSGLDCDTGEPLGAAVRAQLTVTFVFNKVGFTRPGAGQYTGRVEVVDIGVPRALLEELLCQWTNQEARPK